MRVLGLLLLGGLFAWALINCGYAIAILLKALPIESAAKFGLGSILILIIACGLSSIIDRYR